MDKSGNCTVLYIHQQRSPHWRLTRFSILPEFPQSDTFLHLFYNINTQTSKVLLNQTKITIEPYNEP